MLMTPYFIVKSGLDTPDGLKMYDFGYVYTAGKSSPDLTFL